MLILQGVGGLGQRLGMLIFVGGLGTDIGYVNIVGQGRGLGTDIRDYIFSEGWFSAEGIGDRHW